jgi:hypothetical protein
MRPFLWMLLLSALLAGCVAPGQQAYWRAPDDANRQKDHLECLALANQAAMGAGAWTGVDPIAAAFRDQAAGQYYMQCLQSRGYQLVQPR